MQDWGRRRDRGDRIVTPTAPAMGRLELDPRGELPESFAGRRKRQVVFATVAGVFALLAFLQGR